MDTREPGRAPSGQGAMRIEDQTPKLIRIYLAAGWAVLMLLAIVSGLVYRRVAVGRLTYDTEGRAVALAQQFVAASWPDFRTFVRDASGLSPADLREHPQAAAVIDDIRARAQGLPLIQIRLYATDGMIVASTAPDEIGTYTAGTVVLEIAAGRWFGPARPDAHSELARAVTLGAPRTALVDADLVVTHIALRSDFRDIEAVLGLYQDVTPAVRRITRTQGLAMGGVIAIATLAAAVLWSRVRRAGIPNRGEAP